MSMSEEKVETNKNSFIVNVNYQVLMVLIQRISGFLINIIMVVPVFSVRRSLAVGNHPPCHLTALCWESSLKRHSQSLWHFMFLPPVIRFTRAGHLPEPIHVSHYFFILIRFTNTSILWCAVFIFTTFLITQGSLMDLADVMECF